ncbi:2326_t:CDS:2 [Acaulospora morrowiae]|uniref:2326_t:CDS:1 n=1 Tax=Acaulospora morrowiae TaxID=94023 RepID=A0A9N9H9U5_9GLOM|nr:2326_t:CDS:2 [Acaulospora morrowiae]
MTSKVNVISQFILNNFYKLRKFPVDVSKPLIVGISGPQGCGKTTIVGQIAKYLKASYNISAVYCSIDDFYLTFNDQTKLSQRNPDNKLLEYRGEPGTHDILLGANTLRDLCGIQEAYNYFRNKPEHEVNMDDFGDLNKVTIPFYNKSLNHGRGDRAERDSWIQVKPPFDIILFEGWLLGFKHLSKAQLELAYNRALETSSSYTLTSHLLSHLEMINENLKRYEEEWYPFFDLFVHIDAQDINFVYQWRLEQERNRISRGELGMTDEQVYDFVDRYMPAYELYLPTLRKDNFFCSVVEQDGEHRRDNDGDGSKMVKCLNHDQHYGRHLKLVLDIHRDLLDEVVM